jgi:chain length determinant protein (polysaccharide antigen chain regulator)
MQNSNNKVGSSAEIDLFEIGVVVWRRKWLVISFSLIAGLVATAYAFWSTPVYESKYYILPPTVNDIANLNFGRTDSSSLKPFTVDQVFKAFLRNLESESQRRVFFEDNYLPSLAGSASASVNGVLYEEFSKKLTIAPVDKAEDWRWSVTLQDTSPERAKHWAELYVSQVAENTSSELALNAKKEASVQERNLTLKIDILRESSYKVRQDTITKVREALVVAKSSGLENTVVFSGSGSDKLVGSMFQDDAYMRGSKALEAQLKNLESRQSDDPFIPGLRTLQEEADFYKQLVSEKFEFAVYRHDGVQDLPVSPIKPKKSLIILVGLIIGGLLACAFVLLQYFIRKGRATDVGAVTGLE